MSSASATSDGSGWPDRMGSIPTSPAPNPSVATRTGCSAIAAIPIAPAAATKQPSCKDPAGRRVAAQSSDDSPAATPVAASARMRLRICGGRSLSAGAKNSAVASSAGSAAAPTIATLSPGGSACAATIAATSSKRLAKPCPASANGQIAATAASRIACARASAS